MGTGSAPAGELGGTQGDRDGGLATAWRRLRKSLRPRATRGQLAVAALCAVLGFGLAVQVRTTDDDLALRAMRQSDLVRVLDDQSARAERLRAELAELETARQRLRSGSDRTRVAVDEARQRATTLGILAGTLAATGPGVVLTVTDHSGQVEAAHLLDTLEELRGAGAEAVQVGDARGRAVRVVAGTYFRDAAGGIEVDGSILRSPFRFTVIGDPETLAAALAIPGGVTDTLRGTGAATDLARRPRVDVTALRPSSAAQYARSARPE